MDEFYWTYQQTRFRGLSWIPKKYERIMVIVHGIGEHVGRYDHVASFFMKEGFAVIGIDHYGHGKTDGKRGASIGFGFMFDYLEKFLSDVKEKFANKPVVMYGHSMGGGVLTGFLLKRQPKLQAAVISAPALIVGMRPGVFLKNILKVISAIMPNVRINQGLDLNKTSHDQGAIEKFKKDPLRHDKLSFRLANEMIQNGEWCLQHANLLKVDTLLMHGTADEFTAIEGSRLFAERAPIQLLTYKEWDGMYHEMHNEPTGVEVLIFIITWLNRNS